MKIEDNICKAFDITLDKAREFSTQDLPELPEDYKILLIVGSSGGGKSSILRKHFLHNEWQYEWDGESICEHFDSAEDAINRLGAVGLNSIPAWLKPYSVLSTGEKFRADLAINLKSEAVFDEFTSVVDRNVAKSTCVAVNKYINKQDLSKVVFASCHRDIVEWLQPDLVYDVDTKELIDRRSLRQSRPEIKLEIRELKKEEKLKAWDIFARHHYLNEKLNKSARCFVAYWGDVLIGFSSSLTMPSGSLKNAYREHRTVILPDFQGMGLGTNLSNTIAQLHIEEGKRYFSRTTHYRFGEYRQNSPLWKPTSKNRVLRKDILTKPKDELYNNYQGDNKRVCYSHEYIGEK